MSDAFGRGNATLITGGALTEPAVRALDFRSYDVVAFATHGLTSGAIPGLSEPALVLTPPSRPEPGDDGLLTASEIARMDIPAGWVILSACDSGGGRGAGAPTYSGLARAFRTAGARSLLLSHWPVRDDAAAFLTVRTVQNGIGARDRAQALRTAILDLMRSDVPGAAHPAVWAPFVLIGD